jgi:hypothetical protein
MEILKKDLLYILKYGDLLHWSRISLYEKFWTTKFSGYCVVTELINCSMGQIGIPVVLQGLARQNAILNR